MLGCFGLAVRQVQDLLDSACLVRHEAPHDTLVPEALLVGFLTLCLLSLDLVDMFLDVFILFQRVLVPLAPRFPPGARRDRVHIRGVFFLLRHSALPNLILLQTAV